MFYESLQLANYKLELNGYLHKISTKVYNEMSTVKREVTAHHGRYIGNTSICFLLIAMDLFLM